MKQISYLILGALVWLVSACNPVQDQVFDKSASERVEVAIQSVTKTLKAAPKGWNMQLFAGKIQPYGGYNLIVDFSTDDQVTVYNPLVDNGQGVTSLYTVKQCGGVLLSFDTYNKAMHYFSDPINPDGLGAGVGKGLEADLEYVVMEESADRIVLCGLKSQKYAVLTRLADDVVPADYLKALTDMQISFNAPRYALYVNGEKISNLSRHDNVFEGTAKVDGTAATLNMPFVFTQEGLRLYEAVGFDELGGGKTMINFKFDAAKDGMVCTEPGVDALIKKVFPPVNEIFALGKSTWIFSGNVSGANTEQMSPTFATDFKSAFVYNTGSEQITFCLFGANPVLGRTDFSFSFKGTYGTQGAFWFVWTMVPEMVVGTEDQVKFTTLKADLNAGACPKATAFLTKLINKSPYKLTPNSVSDSSHIRFESVADPDYWFEIDFVQ